MQEENWLLQLNKNEQLNAVSSTNDDTKKFGLTLTDEDAKLLNAERNYALAEQERVEFGGGILPKIIYAFCDSGYLEQERYVDTLCRLQEMFYLYKEEAMDLFTDDELITFMREQFDEICYGDLDYLETTCLKNFAEAVRAGYRGYEQTGGSGEYAEFDPVPRWDRELYLEVLKDLCWR